MVKRILILGAGIMQGPLIRCAKSMGLEAAVVDGDPRAPMAELATWFFPIDLKDKEKIASLAEGLAKKGGLSGVVTAGTDFSLSVAHVAEKLGLPGVSAETALKASDKEKMRECFRAASLPSPDFVVLAEAPQKLRFGFPVVVKPADNMGARGCRRADTEAELKAAFKDALEFSRSSRVIVEEYMEGPEFSLDAIVYQGEITICGFADRHIFFPPYFIEMGHTLPSNLEQSQKDAITDVFIRGIRALGIQNGAAKGDIKLTLKGPMIGEIAARLSGGYMSGWTCPYASGADPVRAAICVALGVPPQGLKPVRGWTSAERAFLSIPGIIRRIQGIDEARAVPHVKDLFLVASPGLEMRFPENNVSKGGNVISAAPDRESAVAAAENAARCVLLQLEAPNPLTKAFLAGKKAAFPPSAYVLDKALQKQLRTIPETKMSGASDHLKPNELSRRNACLERASVYPCPGLLDSAQRGDYIGRRPGESLGAVRDLLGLSLPLGTEAPFLGR
ncbi:MAG: ATP-grasp domain-containing protein, partial [Treponema sp.]|nr:ATP-grasp domain-containing protein [Treponema sp.]